MLLAILHLSDIHTAGNKSSFLPERVGSIAAALRSANPLVDHCLVIISGDVTFSGRPDQYEEALHWIAPLNGELLKNFPGTSILAVPGNHDCDFTTESDLRRFVLEPIQSRISEMDEQSKTIQELLSVQSSFFEFQGKLPGAKSAETKPWLIQDETLVAVKDKVRVVSLNTAFMSQISEKKASLGFPLNIASKYLGREQDAALVVAVLHHPYSWLETVNADGLKRLIEASVDVVLTGHEHIQDSYTKELMSGQRLQYVEGAVLESQGSSSSGFNVVLCDLDKKCHKVVEYKWSENRYSVTVERDWKPFVRNDELRRQFNKSLQFSKYLAAVGTGFIHPRKVELRLDDVFVYPDIQEISLEKDELRRDSPSPFIPSSEVRGFVSQTRYLLLIGSDHSGRSALSRKIFADLESVGLVPLLLRGKDLKAKTVPAFLRALDEVYREQYSAESLEPFKQLPPEKKALIIDDWHHTKFAGSARKQIIEAAKRIFGTIIATASDIFRIEEIATHKDDSHPFMDFVHCEIRPFSNLLRGRLIEKWVSLEQDGPADDPAVAREIAQLEKTVRTLLGKKLLPSYPFIVLTLLQASEAVKDTSAPSGSYGYLYEFILTKSIARISKDLTILDLKFVLLSRLAFYLFDREKRRFTREEMHQTVEEYSRDYDIRLNSDTLLEEFESADLIFSTNGKFEFRYKYAYYYFVARYIRDAMVAESRRPEFDQKLADMADRVYYDEYMNILMFVLYLTKDEKLINHIVRRADEIYASVEPCDFERHIAFINKLYTASPKMILASTSYEQAREDARRGLDTEEQAETPESSDPEGKEVTYRDDLEDIIKLNISFKTLQLLGQIVRNFPGSLEKDVKFRLTRSCYLLGLRSLRAILGLAENNVEEFRKYVAEIIRSHKSLVTEEEVARTADEAVIWLARRCGFAVIKRISYSVGLEILVETYRRVLDSVGASRAFQIIDLGIKLDHFQSFPSDDLESLWASADRNLFFRTLIRDLVGTHLYLMPLDDRTKQSVCELLDIKFKRRLSNG